LRKKARYDRVLEHLKALKRISKKRELSFIHNEKKLEVVNAVIKYYKDHIEKLKTKRKKLIEFLTLEENLEMCKRNFELKRNLIEPYLP
ncbi:MAG: hypothetical protein DRI44_05765, partial [Chlamydiae bacterium]